MQEIVRRPDAADRIPADGRGSRRVGIVPGPHGSADRRDPRTGAGGAVEKEREEEALSWTERVLIGDDDSLLHAPTTLRIS
jgi:hypothetical protein